MFCPGNDKFNEFRGSLNHIYGYTENSNQLLLTSRCLFCRHMNAYVLFSDIGMDLLSRMYASVLLAFLNVESVCMMLCECSDINVRCAEQIFVPFGFHEIKVIGPDLSSAKCSVA